MPYCLKQINNRGGKDGSTQFVVSDKLLVETGRRPSFGDTRNRWNRGNNALSRDARETKRPQLVPLKPFPHNQKAVTKTAFFNFQ